MPSKLGFRHSPFDQTETQSDLTVDGQVFNTGGGWTFDAVPASGSPVSLEMPGPGTDSPVSLGPANVIETADAAGSTATTYTLAVGQTAQGHISPVTDSDWYRVNLVAGHTYTFAAAGEGALTNNVQDTYLYLRDSAGGQIALDDDAGPGAYSAITYQATATGTYYLDVQSYNNLTSGQYGLSVTEATRASYDVDMGAGAILTPFSAWGANGTWNTTTPGTPVNVTYGFRQSAPSYSVNGHPTTQSSFTQLTPTEIAGVHSLMQFWSDVSGITFTEVNPGGYTDNATILFGNYLDPNDGAGAFAFYPSSGISGGDVYLNTQSVSTSTALAFGSYSFFAIMHEVGHALGLSHPGDYNAGPNVTITYSQFAQFTQDTQQYSIMSYFDEANTGAEFKGYADTPMLLDVLAQQQIYGVNTTTRTGDTIYGFNTNAGSVYNFTTNANPAFCIWDAGGTDTIDCSGYATAQTINLTPGEYSSIGGLSQNIVIAMGATIENAVGGSAGDSIYLSAQNVANLINGNGGTDTVYVTYNFGSGYTLSGTAANVTMSGSAGTDTLQNIEFVHFATGETVATSTLLASSNHAPVISSDGSGDTATISVAENSTAATTVTATDQDAGQTLAYAIVGGADQALFQLNGATHALSFIVAPDYEAPSDSDHNNSYVVQVQVTDNGTPNLSDIQTITVNVTDVAPVIPGDGGDNLLTGTPENDTLQGLGGNDVLVGLASNNILDGGTGNDTASYSAAPGAVSASLATNTATSNGYGGTDTFISIENLVGSAFGDFLIGDSLANTLNGLGGADNMSGGAGDDVYVVDNGGDVVTENANEGTDTVYSSVNYALTVNVENLILQGAAVQGYGNAAVNTLYGTTGDNLLNGDAGADTMVGGAGNDVYFVDSIGDATVENANEGNDTVFSTVSMTLAADVENLILQGAADLQGYGNALANVIYGNTGNNLLDAGAGTDLMVGGAGNDVYYADNSSDACFEVANQGNDTVFSTASYGLAADVENLILQGSADLQGYGNAGDNVIYGNAGNNLLNAGAGVDLMAGGLGDDVYFVDNSSDACFEVVGQGNDTVFSTASYGLAADVENLILQGSADLQGYGSAGANALYGNSGNNLLNGGGGADQMLGGAGNDIYYVDNIGDSVSELANQGNDTVFSSVDYALSANVENLILQGAANLNGFGNSQINTIYGNAGINNLDGGAGADILTGNAGNDVFIFHPGEANGDTIADFTGAGAAAGDLIHFTGYAPGATFTFVDATHWQVNYNGGASHDIILFQNGVGASIDLNDYSFV